MADLRLTCSGVRVGTFTVPTFHLRVRELVCLHLPRAAPDDLNDNLLRILTGAHPTPGFRLFGRVLPVIPAQDGRAMLVRLLRPLRASQWLQRHAAMSFREAKETLGRIGLNRDWPLTQLAGTPKTLLALEAAWANGAEAIVFQTAGLDPCGVQAVNAAVASRLASCPAIHLSHSVLQNGHPYRDCLADSRCIELFESAALPLPAESA